MTLRSKWILQNKWEIFHFHDCGCQIVASHYRQQLTMLLLCNFKWKILMEIVKNSESCKISFFLWYQYCSSSSNSSVSRMLIDVFVCYVSCCEWSALKKSRDDYVQRLNTIYANNLSKVCLILYKTLLCNWWQMYCRICFYSFIVRWYTWSLNIARLH